MASNIHVAAAYRKGMLDGSVNIKTDANSGVLNIYSGTQPVDGDTALSGNTLLASLTMNAGQGAERGTFYVAPVP